MQLSSEQLAMLLHEVAAMVTSGRPIAAGLVDLQHPSMGRLGRAAKAVTKRLEKGELVSTAVSDVAGRYAGVTQAALESLTRTGSAASIYQIANILRQDHERRMRSLAATIYPAITLLIAYLILALVVPTLVITLHENNLQSVAFPAWVIEACNWMQQGFWLPLSIAIGCMVFWWMVCFLLGKQVTLPWTDRAARFQNWASFCDMLAIESETGAPLEEALDVAGRVANCEASLQQTIQTLSAEAVETKQLSLPSSMPPMLRWTVERLAQRLNSGDADEHPAEELRSLADWYQERSRSQSRFWLEWFPILMATGLVLVLLLAMC